MLSPTDRGWRVLRHRAMPITAVLEGSVSRHFVSLMSRSAHFGAPSVAAATLLWAACCVLHAD
jgi:hypothetical protein